MDYPGRFQIKLYASCALDPSGNTAGSAILHYAGVWDDGSTTPNSPEIRVDPAHAVMSYCQIAQVRPDLASLRWVACGMSDDFHIQID